MIRIVVVFLWILSAQAVQAAAFYFSSSGSNANPCSQASPCQTTAHAETLSLGAGDSLLFKRGDTFTANTQFDLMWSGTSGNEITIGAYGTGTRPVLSSGVPTTSTNTGLRCDEKSNLRVEHLRLTGWLKGIQLSGCFNLVLDDLEVDTIRGECVRFFHGAHDVTLEDSFIHDCGTALGNGEGLYIGTDTSQDGGVPDTVHDIILQRNEIYNTLHEPIDMKAGILNISVLDNYIHDSHQQGSFGGGILAVGPHPNAPTVNGNHLIRGNRVANLTGNFGRGIYCRSGCRIHQNRVYHNSQQGIFIERVYGPSRPVELFNNTLVSNAGAAIQVQASAAADVTSTNNLAWANGAGNATSDPRFASLAARDYRLCTGSNVPLSGCPGASNAIDAGSNVGLAFTGAAPDLGALETAVGATTPDYTSNLVMHLKFDEGTLPTAEDSTANNHDGTLGSGATWGAAQMGAFSVALDGTTNGVVTVTGELDTPAAVTLAAWVKPSAFPTPTRAEILSIGDHVVLRVNATTVTGLYYTGATWVELSVTSALGTTAWHHLAYTVQAGTQRLYIDGAPVGSGSSGAAISYAGLGSDTRLGAHGHLATDSRFQGLIDDARVYNRALTSTDIAGLATLDDPPPLSIQITTPTTSDTYSTTVSPLPNLGGVASDDIGVTGVTWNCPTCATTTGAATCTPACGVATTFTNWVVPSITFPAAGTHLITVTAVDGSSPPATDTLTVTYTEPPAAGACTHYASQAGGGNGLSVGSPFQIVTFWSVAGPNATLCLLDGTYTGGNSMVQPPADLAGTMSQPITIQAVNDGAALLDGQHARNPVVVGSTNQWFVVQGLNARNGLTAVYQFLGSNNRGARLAGWVDAATPGLGSIFTVTGTNTVVEDAVGWGPKTQVIFQGSGTVSSSGSGYRRTWCEWQSLPTGSTTPGACYQPGKDQRLENVVGTIRETE